jgi:hypothetical protein
LRHPSLIAWKAAAKGLPAASQAEGLRIAAQAVAVVTDTHDLSGPSVSLAGARL